MTPSAAANGTERATQLPADLREHFESDPSLMEELREADAALKRGELGTPWEEVLEKARARRAEATA